MVDRNTAEAVLSRTWWLRMVNQPRVRRCGLKALTTARRDVSCTMPSNDDSLSFCS
jgi:hypothetical protein